MNWAVFALLAGSLAGAARGAETRQDRAKRVINEAVQALGGDAFLHMEDRVEHGRAYSFYREQLTGLSVAKIYTRYLAPAPGQLSVRERDSFGKVDARSHELSESNALLFTEEGAWEITFRGVRPLDEQRYANYKDSMLRNIFYILRQRLGEPGTTLYSQDADFYEHRPVEIVDITDADNLTVTVYFDQSTKLPVRQTFRRRNPEYKDFDTEVSIFAKYKDINGVKWPQVIQRQRNGEKIFEMYSDAVEINQNLKDTLFALPVNAKMLPKAK
ncbi:MAG TPA: hypothetical protein VGZ73_30590 [Bryobacteraceae bacterium]|jgi:hypothetical protein|nr:hypothetical protein [Bryobacteraceae bacterium]